jgi:hypothetical protein
VLRSAPIEILPTIGRTEPPLEPLETATPVSAIAPIPVAIPLARENPPAADLVVEHPIERQTRSTAVVLIFIFLSFVS